MDITLTFMGAARGVTGSRYLLETGNLKLLVDCGLYQEREFLGRNWEPFRYPPAGLHAVLLTHAHLDHSMRPTSRKRTPLTRKSGISGKAGGDPTRKYRSTRWPMPRPPCRFLPPSNTTRW
jgi:ribonuclease BN (tRNA processing enzyme)